jgi:hypothetical protein
MFNIDGRAAFRIVLSVSSSLFFEVIAGNASRNLDDFFVSYFGLSSPDET